MTKGNDMGYTAAAIRGLTALSALVLVSACVPGLGDDESAPPAPVGSGQLSDEQLTAALPHDDQVPQGFTREVAEEAEAADDTDPEATAYPATCLDLRLAGESGTELKKHVKTKQKTSFQGEKGGYLSVTISSHDQAVPATLFDDAGAAQSQCGTFDLIDKDGTTSWKVEPLAFPQMGDRTYSARVEATTKGDIFEGGVVQIAGISVGNNLVYVVYSAGPKSTFDPTAAETFAQATVDNLDAL